MIGLQVCSGPVRSEAELPANVRKAFAAKVGRMTSAGRLSGRGRRSCLRRTGVWSNARFNLEAVSQLATDSGRAEEGSPKDSMCVLSCCRLALQVYHLVV